MVLEVGWLSTLGPPIVWDFSQLTIKFDWGNKNIYLKGSKGEGITVDGRGLVLMTEVPEIENVILHEDVKQLLDQFPRVFNTLQGPLLDHKIKNCS